MDLGIKGRKAIVCASSKGLGLGCAEELAANGVDLVMNARTADVLNASADRLRETYGVKVTAVATDITTVDGRAEVLAAAEGTVDILVNNAGGPPPGDFRDWEMDDWNAAINANMLTPIELIKAVIDPMIDQRFGRIVNITSGSVKNPIPQLGMSNGARAGLTGFVAGLARQVAQHNVTINNLLPGQFDTDRINGLFKSRSEKEGRPADVIRAEAEAANPCRRIGAIHEFGQACGFLCSAHSGYVVGQNLLVDGGAFNSSH
ncbi:MAG: SDR family oxidoreductase [Alphaproteobacteria bacterium]|nr:SDR family oxidoreductase [Alphaproteobacteria bacterium]